MKVHRSSETMLKSNRILRSRSKEISTLKNAVGGVEQWEAKEFAMGECGAGVEEQQVRPSIRYQPDHSSLESISTDEEDLVPNHSLDGPSQRKNKSARKLSDEADHSGENERLPFKCEKCGRAFKVERYLRKHLARSCGNMPQFSCQECGHQYKRKEELQNHLMKKHNVEKSQLALFGAGPKIRPVHPFKCQKCEKTYKQKKGLTQHLKSGCDLDPSFPCTLCDYQSSRKSTLRDHLISGVVRSQFPSFGAAAPITRPVQPFKCEQCGRTYKQKNSLSQHLKYECDIDPSFFCTQCDYRASQKSTLKRHLVNVHASAGPEIVVKKL